MSNPTPRRDARQYVTDIADKAGIGYEITEERVRPNDNEFVIRAVDTDGVTIVVDGHAAESTYRAIIGEHAAF